jgi:hypothetical protein
VVVIADLGWIAFIGLTAWTLYRVLKPKPMVSRVQRSDAYGLPPQGGSQWLIKLACEESLRRSRVRRGLAQPVLPADDRYASVRVYTIPKLGQWRV